MQLLFPHRRGSTMTLTIVVAVVLTGLITAMAWVAGVQSQQTGNFRQSDQAFYAAEAGAQRVAWYCKNNQMAALTSPVTGTVNGFTYSVTWTTLSGSTIHIASVGGLNDVSYTLALDVTPPAVISAMACQGDFDNKNFNITGDVAVGGNYTNSNGGALHGNLTYAGTASGTGSVTGTVSQGSFKTLDFAQLGTLLRTNATTLGTNATYDFTQLSGTNKVIYVNGNVVNPAIIGSGTLYVNGSLSFTTTTTIGAANAPVYLVATGNISFNKNDTLYGGLYTPGNWTRAQIAGTAVIYIGQQIDKTNGGTSSMTMGAAPWFDTRGANAATTAANFTGPQP